MTLADHVYSIGSAKQASDYSVITQFIINHIRKNYEYGADIGDTLEKREEPTFEAPKLLAVAADSTDKELEAKQNEILYRARLRPLEITDINNELDASSGPRNPSNG